MNARVSLVDVIEDFARAMPESASVHVDRIFPAWAAARELTPAETRILRFAV